MGLAGLGLACQGALQRNLAVQVLGCCVAQRLVGRGCGYFSPSRSLGATQASPGN
jgi:hypothetical protein